MDNSGKARATTAAALLLMAGQAEAATVVVPLDQLLANGAGALSGQFNIGSLLTDSDGTQYRATSANIVAFGYSDALLNSIQPGQYGNYGVVSSYYAPGYSYSHSCGWGRTCYEYVPSYYSAVYERERLTTRTDTVADAMLLTAGSASATGEVGEQPLGPISGRSYVTASYSYGYYSNVTYRDYERFQDGGLFGGLSAIATLGAADLEAMSTSGLLDYTVSATNGQFRIGQLALNLELEAVTSVPEPQTWAMMIAGFGLVGAALRRKQKLETAAA